MDTPALAVEIQLPSNARDYVRVADVPGVGRRLVTSRVALGGGGAVECRVQAERLFVVVLDPPPPGSTSEFTCRGARREITVHLEVAAGPEPLGMLSTESPGLARVAVTTGGSIRVGLSALGFEAPPQTVIGEGWSCEVRDAPDGTALRISAWTDGTCQLRGPDGAPHPVEIVSR